MDHRVTVTICGNEYTFVAEEDSTYVEKVAEYVDRKMTETLEATKAGQTDVAVLTAVDVGPGEAVLPADEVERDVYLTSAADGGYVIVSAVAVVGLAGVQVKVELLGRGVERGGVAALVE